MASIVICQYPRTPPPAINQVEAKVSKVQKNVEPSKRTENELVSAICSDLVDRTLLKLSKLLRAWNDQIFDLRLRRQC